MHVETAQERRQAMAASLLFGVFGIAAITWLSLRVTPDMENVALVFPPSFSADQTLEAVARADGRIARFGAAGNVVIANFMGLEADRIIEKTGALAAMNPLAPGACFSLAIEK